MELAYCYNGIVWAIFWDPNKGTSVRECSICGGGRFVSFYCMILIPILVVSQLQRHLKRGDIYIYSQDYVSGVTDYPYGIALR